MSNELTTINDKYLYALSAAADWLTVSEWALKVAELFPDLLANADAQAAKQRNDTTGLREIAARLSSRISSGGFGSHIEVDTTERPKRVRFLTPNEQQQHEAEEVEEDLAPLRRIDIIKRDSEQLSVAEQYRIDEFEAISRQLKAYFGLDFEVDHAAALLNSKAPGKHHPDNLQLLLKAHNAKKHANNWPRFSFAEQKQYIEAAITLQTLVASRMSVEVETRVMASLLSRLEAVYGS
ncbi:HNH endonuclease [Alishewanella sp. 16-MA]|uniref:HNH endonuclease n=1 Tax=Alishewanella maricola TaxID=2795740 RepID=A0ABS8C394_9ALTE|nr:HNH endonuclease [Alishewanella maricola]MCB5226648.1 HNH endonuclease [Alishewanella maricola]